MYGSGIIKSELLNSVYTNPDLSHPTLPILLTDNLNINCAIYI